MRVPRSTRSRRRRTRCRSGAIRSPRTSSTNGDVDLLPGQEVAFGGLEPAALWTEEGAGVLVLARRRGNRGSARPATGTPESTVSPSPGADTGGGIIVNGYADYMQISNNRVINNSGLYGGGIRVGHPYLIAEGAGCGNGGDLATPTPRTTIS